jgi:hypothetical protein
MTIRNWILLTIIFLGVNQFAQSQDTKNMLFIGNSYTGYNNLAAMVSTCATSAGDAITFDTHTPGAPHFYNIARMQQKSKKYQQAIGILWCFRNKVSAHHFQMLKWLMRFILMQQN